MNAMTRCYVLMATLALMVSATGPAKADVVVYAVRSRTRTLRHLALWTGQWASSA